MRLSTFNLWNFMSLQWLNDLINREGLFLIVLNKILRFWMYSSNYVLIFGQLLKQEDFFLTTRNVENKFTLRLRYKFQVSIILFVRNKNFPILRFKIRNIDCILFYFFIYVCCLLQFWNRTEIWLELAWHMACLIGMIISVLKP